MDTSENNACWRKMISPLRLVLLSVNAVCLGGFIVLLAIGSTSGPLVLLTIGAGLSFMAGLAGAIVAARKHLQIGNEDDK